MDPIKQLVAEIEAFLAATGMSPTRFGIEVDGDRMLMTRLRRGRPVTMKKAARVMNYIRANKPKRPAKRQRRASSAFDLVA